MFTVLDEALSINNLPGLFHIVVVTLTRLQLTAL